jgi:glutamyl-tRNA synthetase
VTDAVRPMLAALADKLSTVTWDKTSIASAIKEILVANSIKMPALAMPVRVLLMGTSQTPSLDSVLALFSREIVTKRLKEA